MKKFKFYTFELAVMNKKNYIKYMCNNKGRCSYPFMVKTKKKYKKKMEKTLKYLIQNS